MLPFAVLCFFINIFQFHAVANHELNKQFNYSVTYSKTSHLKLNYRKVRQDDYCEPANCNYAGLCAMVSGSQVCSCIEGYYEGDICDQPTDLCSFADACQGGGVCRSYPGVQHCKCPSHLHGQFCDIPMNSNEAPYPDNIFFLFNRIMTVGQEENIMVTFQEVGEQNVHYLLIFDDYGTINSVIISKSTFKQSNDLKQIATSNGLDLANSLPYNSGWYFITKTTQYYVGTRAVNIGILLDLQIPGNFEVILPKDKCLPEIHLPECELNHPELIDVDTTKDFSINSKVHRSCLKNSQFVYKWTVYDLFYNAKHHEFKTNKEKLVVPAYQLIYPQGYVIGYTIRLDAQEIGEGQTLTSVSRCSFYPKEKQIKAIIKGNSPRQVKFNESFVLDGSTSYDNYFPRNKDNKIIFSWSCTTLDNEKDKFCDNLQSKESIVEVPANALKLGRSYSFKLTATSSTLDYRSVHSTQQVVRVVIEVEEIPPSTTQAPQESFEDLWDSLDFLIGVCLFLLIVLTMCCLYVWFVLFLVKRSEEGSDEDE